MTQQAGNEIGGDVEQDVSVTDAPERSRYEITVDGKLAGFADYRTRADRVVITHSEIDDAYQGRGLAGRLTRTALDDIRAKDLLVTPLCPYTASYIRKHPEYVDLVDDNHRAAVS
ncbi:MAG TPA: GNAT family N-acetyltransferase [Pseudonocardia sp.]|jgi:predicted GNAT family acetyltransferase|nr:GNAT family N-acetyltransferase [Pseudonocardia sp.]